MKHHILFLYQYVNYIPNHPFQTGDKLTFTKSPKLTTTSLLVGNNNSQTDTFYIPDTVLDTYTVYAINKGRDYIGLTTSVGLTTTGDGLYFFTDGSDESDYLLKTNKDQVTGEVDKIITT